jgi:hypothetical protein
MNDAPVSILAYVLVGITSAVLAIVTIMDKDDYENAENQDSSVSTMLPNLNNKTDEPTEEDSGYRTPVAVAVEEPIRSQEENPIEKVGGKKHKTRRNKHNKNKSSRKN